jgi:hypothetical protein
VTKSRDVVDFGPCLVNTVVAKEVSLCNPCECDVYFKLFAVKVIDSNEDQILVDDLESSELEIIQKSNIIPARSNQNISLRACLKSADAYRFKIFYILDCKHSFLIYPDPEDIDPSETSTSSKLIQKKPMGERVLLYDISATGVFRSMQVTDILCEGVSKRRLWELFNLPRFNDILRSMTPEKRQLSESAKGVDNNEPIKELEQLQNSESSLDFDFGAMPIGYAIF